MDTANLGGRLPLLDPADLNDAQKPVYGRLANTMVRWADQVGFQSTTDGGKLIGPFNPVLFSPGITSAFLDLQSAEQKHTTLSERVRQIIILSVGAVWRSEYELYAHAAAARKAGLSDNIIMTIVAGGLPDDLSEAETLALRYARQLSSEHRVCAPLYAAAEQAFRPQGLVDITYLVGIYQIVCGLLNAFDIPAPAGQFPAKALGKDPHRDPSKARLTTVALFPVKSFLENLAVRDDNSVLVTSMNARELWYVPPSTEAVPVDPILLHTFDQPTTGLVEIEPNIFLVSTSNLYSSHESYLHRLDLIGWEPGTSAAPERVFCFPDMARGLNGSCLLAPGIVLIADCFASLIWRVDVQPGGRAMQARTWLKDDSMGYFPGKLKPEQPGVNGIRFAARTNQLYYTATAKKLLMRVAVDPETFEPAGQPELVVAGRMGDDFCIDEDANVIYLATHRQNTIDRISMDPGDNSGFPQSVAGDPFNEELIGPSSGAWSRAAGEYGKVAFFISDGGTASPPPSGRQHAKLLRVEF